MPAFARHDRLTLLDGVMSAGNPIERAFELARSGQCRSIEDIRRTLKAERYDNEEGYIGGGAIKRQLLEAMKLVD